MLRCPFSLRGPLNKSASFAFPAASSTWPYPPARHASTAPKAKTPRLKPMRAPKPLSHYLVQIEHERSRGWIPRPLEGFNVVISDENLKALDATQVHSIYSAYREAEIENVKNQTSLGWRRDFVKTHNIKPSLLHDIALHMFQTPRSDSDGRVADWDYACRLMETAGELGYRPAVLDLVRRIIQSSSGTGGLPNSPLYTRFRDIVAEDRDPDAQTLQGIIYAKQGDHPRALRFLQRGKALGETCGPFQLKPLCLSQMGMILEKQGKRELAESEYAELARENTALGFYHLGLLYKAEPIARWLFQKAASGGVFRAMTELGEMELRHYKKAVGDGHQAAAQTHLKDSQEWHRLASIWSSGVPPTSETY